jgi:hypothetical protein
MREREGLIFWLFEERNIKKVLYLIKNMFNNYMIKDTKEEIVFYTYCKLFGHVKDFTTVEDDMSVEQDIYCKHCKRYITSLSYEEHKKHIRVKKFKNII